MCQRFIGYSIEEAEKIWIEIEILVNASVTTEFVIVSQDFTDHGDITVKAFCDINLFFIKIWAPALTN